MEETRAPQLQKVGCKRQGVAAVVGSERNVRRGVLLKEKGACIQAGGKEPLDLTAESGGREEQRIQGDWGG